MVKDETKFKGVNNCMAGAVRYLLRGRHIKN